MSMKPSIDISSGSKSTSILDRAAMEYFSEPAEYRLHEVFEAARGLIYHFCKLYGQGFNVEDVYQAGSEGLLKALKKYDHASENSFTTYACSLIIGEIRHYVRKEKSYYMPVTIEKLQKSMDETILKILEKENKLPTEENIAQELNVKIQALPEILRAGLVPYEELRMSNISSAKYETFKLPIEDRLLLDAAIKKLSDMQKKVLYLLFYSGMTQEQTAKKLGLNQRKVSRLKQSSLDSLRDSFEE